MIVGFRLGGADPPDARPTDGSDGALFQGTSHVCDAGVQEERDGWDAVEETPDGVGEHPVLVRCFQILILRSWLGGRTYGNDGPAVELSAWQAYNAAFGGHCESTDVAEEGENG